MSNHSMSMFGVCTCEVCMGQEIPSPDGRECADCGEPIENREAFDAEQDSDGDWRFYHASCPSMDAPINEPGGAVVQEPMVVVNERIFEV